MRYNILFVLKYPSLRFYIFLCLSFEIVKIHVKIHLNIWLQFYSSKSNGALTRIRANTSVTTSLSFVHLVKCKRNRRVSFIAVRPKRYSKYPEVFQRCKVSAAPLLVQCCSLFFKKTITVFE